MRKIFAALILILPSLVYGDPGDIYEMATENNVFVGARAAGMGGAQIAAGEDGSALWYNPALLTRIRRMELSGALTHQRFFNQTRFAGVSGNEYQVNKTRLSSLWGVFPVPTEQGGLSLAMAANRVKSFDRLFRFESSGGWLVNPLGEGIGGGEDDLGSLWAYSFGGGLELSRYVSMGAAVEFYDGENDYNYFDEEIYEGDIYTYRYEIKSNYSGYSGKVGIAYSKSPSFHLGATIKFPTYLTIEQEEYDLDGYLDGRGKYKYRLPFSFGIGTMMANRHLILAFDLNYTDYMQLEYTSGVDYDDELDVRDVYDAVVSINAGAEYMFPSLGLTIRGGYSHDPIPYTYYPLDNDLDVFTAGFGYLLDKSLKIDVALNLLNWTRRDNNFLNEYTVEKYKAQRMFISFTYRI